MAKKEQKTSFSSILGQRGAKAFEGSKNNEVVYDRGGELPVIQAGVAQLISMTIGVYKNGPNKDKPFFRAAGTVLSPKKVRDDDGNEIPVAGLQTSIMIPLCDTKTQKGEVTKMEEHMEKMINEVKKFGVDLSEVSFDDFDSTLEALVETAPQFKFRTWKSKATKEYPDPRCNHVWNGIVEEDDQVSTDDEGAVEVDDDAEAGEDDASESDTGEDDAGGEEDTSSADDAPAVDEKQLAELVKKANKKDKKAQQELIELAVAAGHTQEEAENADDWESVAALAREPVGGGDGDSGEGDSSSDEIEVGNQVQYRPIDAKTKKPGKAVDCEVVKVYKTGNLDLKNLVDNKTVYKNIEPDSVIR